MNKGLEGLLVRIFADEEGNDAALVVRSLQALSAAGYRADEAMVQGALTTCHDSQSFAWDLMRSAGVPET